MHGKGEKVEENRVYKGDFRADKFNGALMLLLLLLLQAHFFCARVACPVRFSFGGFNKRQRRCLIHFLLLHTHPLIHRSWDPHF